MTAPFRCFYCNDPITHPKYRADALKLAFCTGCYIIWDPDWAPRALDPASATQLSRALRFIAAELSEIKTGAPATPD